MGYATEANGFLSLGAYPIDARHHNRTGIPCFAMYSLTWRTVSSPK